MGKFSKIFHHIETKDLEVGQDKISNLGPDGTMNIVSPPTSVPALTESIKEAALNVDNQAIHI